MLRLREMREKRGMTQVSLATAVGVAQGYISALENGLYSPSFEILIKLAKALNCSLDELVDMDSEASAS